MEKEAIKEAIIRYLSNEASEKETALLEDWYLQRDVHNISALSAEELQEDLLIISTGLPLVSPIKKHIIWRKVAAAIAILFTVGLGYYFYSKKLTTPQTNNYASIKPGNIGATLTTSGGEVISLSKIKNGKISESPHLVITKTAKGEIIYKIISNVNRKNSYNTLATSKGETYSVILSDGSKIWLNAASTLKYPENFNSLSQREVELSGEGYFEIAKDKAHPFIVKTKKQKVQVLGTHFNISAYPDDPATLTTLIEGSVNVQTVNKQSANLKPGEQARVSQNLNIEKIDPTSALSWKNGEFTFDSESLEQIMKKISRWYNINIIYEDPQLKNIVLDGSMSRYENAGRLLRTIEFSAKVRLRVEGKKIYVSR